MRTELHRTDKEWKRLIAQVNEVRLEQDLSLSKACQEVGISVTSYWHYMHRFETGAGGASVSS